ncbi:MAG: NlpC/P60 family protein [Oleiphilaceae bacterium]|nr:NlpC/P60 family protein [Oleiphilaceae bacterium]
MIKPLLSLSLILVFLAGCAGPGGLVEAPAQVTKHPEAVALSDQPLVKEKLMAQFRQWRGTPYQYGGVGGEGFDCSGFVYHSFRTQLGRDLPRTTAGQIRLGESVADSRRQVGDLVFFKTGFKKRHVGIYLGEAEFLHASTSQGVTISSLKNPYWQSGYWQTRRLPE